MTEKIIGVLVILICAARVTSYGVYTAKKRNISGAVSLFVLAAVVLLSSAYFFAT